MNNIYNSKYIFKQLKEYKKDISVNQVSKLPFLIRNNGLVSTLEYLFDKDDKNLGEFTLQCIFKNKKISREIFIKELKSMKAFDYMMLQKDVYMFSIKLRSVVLSKKEEKNDSKRI